MDQLSLSIVAAVIVSLAVIYWGFPRMMRTLIKKRLGGYIRAG